MTHRIVGIVLQLKIAVEIMLASPVVRIGSVLNK